MENKLEKLKEFFKDAKVELDKVIFPTKIQVRQAFVAVILVVTVISIFLALVDMLMSAIVSSTI
jgi:preprotein translocase subunit SecE